MVYAVIENLVVMVSMLLVPEVVLTPPQGFGQTQTANDSTAIEQLAESD